MRPTAERIPIPGGWRCPRCRFTLHKNILSAVDGSVGVDESRKREVCPNDGATLEQLYEEPNDRLGVYGPCECKRDPACLRCGGGGERLVGWRYRDEGLDTIRPFSDEGDR